jgi:hypothetical protein
MKNEYLVPVNVVDIADRLKSPSLNINERMNLVLRLEAIRDFCEKIIEKNNGEFEGKRISK